MFNSIVERMRRDCLSLL